MSVLTAVDTLVPTLQAHQELSTVVHRHAQRPNINERFKDAMACSKVPQHFANACNDRAKASALHLAGAAWTVTQGAMRSGYMEAQQQYQASCGGAPEAPESTPATPATTTTALKAWATLASGAAFVRGSSATAYSLLGARGGEMVYDATCIAMAGAAGWAGSITLPVAMPLAGLLGATAFEINELSTNVRAACEEMEGGPVRLPEEA